MRIAIDASAIVGSPTEAENYVVNLIRALAQLKARCLDVRGLIVGEGPDLESLR